MKREALYRPLAILLPIAAVCCASGVSGYQWRRLKQVEGESSTATLKLAEIDRQMRTFEAQPPTEKYPTVPKTPSEQGLFLDALRANADVSHVQLVRWSNTTQPPPPPSTDKATADKAAASPMAGITSIVSIVEVSGHADNTRHFLYNVTRSRRLYNLSDLKWARDQWPNTHLTLTLTRYVAPPVPLPAGHTAVAATDPAAPSNQAPGTSLTPASSGVSVPHGPGVQGEQISVLNPMDAPGIAHRTYQTRLEAGVSQLNDMTRPEPSAPPRGASVTNAKRLLSRRYLSETRTSFDTVGFAVPAARVLDRSGVGSSNRIRADTACG